jgi:hypothetical protein
MVVTFLKRVSDCNLRPVQGRFLKELFLNVIILSDAYLYVLLICYSLTSLSITSCFVPIIISFKFFKTSLGQVEDTPPSFRFLIIFQQLFHLWQTFSLVCIVLSPRFSTFITRLIA